jgi:predicted AlkP superfamily pyrophosphatase or phosphodiesterase
MKAKRLILAGVAAALSLVWPTHGNVVRAGSGSGGRIDHVVLLSIDGMHAVDFLNCSHGIAGVNDGRPYCPNLTALSQTGIDYVGTISSRPSDSFPGLAALVTGGSPKTTGLYYDVAYDRSLDPPAATTGSGLAGSPGACKPYAAPTGTTTDFDQGIEYNDTALNGGAPAPYSVTDGGIQSINPSFLERDPATGCTPVFPWDFVRTNTIFSVAHSAGMYTAWIDKHASYSFTAGPGGYGLDDYYSPEVGSAVIPLPGVTTAEGVSCATIRDKSSAGESAWNAGFENIQCYDALKVQALKYEIAGKNHNGNAQTAVPALFGMNFQSVYVGESVYEPKVGNGGYLNAAGAPGDKLLNEIEFVDASIGEIVTALKNAGIFDDTLLIVTAKHGASPIDPNAYIANGTSTPATLLAQAGYIPASESPLTQGGIGATEDDVSVMWLNPGSDVEKAVAILETPKNFAATGLGELFYGPSLALNYNQGGLGPGLDPRSPDIIVTPNIGMTYSSANTMIADHGGFAHDDTNVVMLVSNPSFTAQTVATPVTTMQVAPTIMKALGLDPKALDAVRAEGTQVLPEVAGQLPQ